jgi:hypothetical protein
LQLTVVSIRARLRSDADAVRRDHRTPHSRHPPGTVSTDNFNSLAIYWTSTEASADEAYGFKLEGLRQGPLAKDPFAPVLDVRPVMLNPVLAWPVHDGDVGAEIAGRWMRAILIDLWRDLARRFRG